jgi:hypothetical protein
MCDVANSAKQNLRGSVEEIFETVPEKDVRAAVIILCKTFII